MDASLLLSRDPLNCFRMLSFLLMWPCTIHALRCGLLSARCTTWPWHWVSRLGRRGRDLGGWTDWLSRLENQHCLDQAGTISISLAWFSFSLKITREMRRTGRKAYIRVNPQLRWKVSWTESCPRTKLMVLLICCKLVNHRDAPLPEDGLHHAALQRPLMVFRKSFADTIRKLVLRTGMCASVGLMSSLMCKCQKTLLLPVKAGQNRLLAAFLHNTLWCY